MVLAGERQTIDGVIWRLKRSSAGGRALPAEHGPWLRPAQLRIRWPKVGTRGEELDSLWSVDA